MSPTPLILKFYDLDNVTRTQNAFPPKLSEQGPWYMEPSTTKAAISLGSGNEACQLCWNALGLSKLFLADPGTGCAIWLLEQEVVFTMRNCFSQCTGTCCTTPEGSTVPPQRWGVTGKCRLQTPQGTQASKNLAPSDGPQPSLGVPTGPSLL